MEILNRMLKLSLILAQTSIKAVELLVRVSKELL